MTDDKGAGEGPYTATPDDKYINAIKAQAYAEGRKSMEKEFQKAIGWADSICFDWNYSKDYKKWKKARGIDSLNMTKHWPSERFTKGMRVKMVEGTKAFSGKGRRGEDRSHGVVVGFGENTIYVIQDGNKSAICFHESFWEPEVVE